MKRKILDYAILAAICAGALLFAVVVFVPRTAEVFGFGRNPSGQMEIEVLDGENNAPIEGAEIVIPEAKLRLTTDPEGKTGTLTIPIIKDARFSKILPKTWGEVTILVYKDGYAPYMLSNAQVFENQTRNGPLIYLFKNTGNGDSLSLVEAPDKYWVDDVIEKYAPSAPDDSGQENTDSAQNGN